MFLRDGTPGRRTRENDLAQIRPRVKPFVCLHGSRTIERKYAVDHRAQFP